MNKISNKHETNEIFFVFFLIVKITKTIIKSLYNMTDKYLQYIYVYIL